MEAGRSHGLAPGAVEAHAGVDVAREGVRVARGFVVGLVHEPEGAELVGAADALDAPVAGRVSGGAVVVAADQEDVERRVRGAPRGDGVDRGCVEPALVVEEVAQHDEARCAGEGEGVVESREVGAGRAAGDGDACVAEGGGLAKVRVGEEEGAFARPEDGAVGEERQILGRERRVRGAGDWPDDLWVWLDERPLGRGAPLSIGTGLLFVARGVVGVASSSR